MALDDYNSNPDLNTSISGINIAEGCPPSGINNAIRQLMADLKNKIVLATTSVAGLMSASDKSKLNGIAANANNYVHPTTAGNKHIPAGGSSGQILRWSAAGTAVWGADNNTTYSNFVKSGASAAAGLVPKPPTTAGTTKYLREDGTWTVPPDTNTTYGDATTAAKGLVKVGTNITVSGGTISLTKANVTNALGYTPPTRDTNTTYSNFTKATASAAGTSGLVPAPGAGKQNSFLRGDGTWSMPASYTHPSYTARTGVPTGNQSPGFGGTFQVNQVNCDGQGHVTAVTARNITLPAFPTSPTFSSLTVNSWADLSGNITFPANTVVDFKSGSYVNVDNLFTATKSNTGFKVENGSKTCTLLRGAAYVGLYDSANGQWIVRVNDGNGTNDSYWHYGVVKTVSDEREKKDISVVPDGLLDAWADVQWQQFRYIKDDARASVGLVAQRAEAALRGHGIDAWDYGFISHEQDEGNDKYYVQYTEAFAIEAAYQRRRADSAEARIAALEEQVRALMAVRE